MGLGTVTEKKRLVRRRVGELDGFVGGGGGVAAYGDEFGGDGYSDFFGSERADFEAHGGEDARESFGGDALLFENFVAGDDFAFAADHADVPGVGSDGPFEDAKIVLVTASDDDDVGGAIGREF